ncbi:hypothetical protein FRB96_005356 [Tulasnella sp. 330]|nr:hypothetical protein FRB96_005356 [Tulasnella sp. 330]KAG8870858.1 hypothetical protein FRB98_001302 [Tulasnella sp. 332]
MTTPVTPSQQNIPGPTSGRQVNPSEVGWQFVPQYYTFVNKHPHRLHCFYTKNSTFINGTEGEDGKACYGQHEIHQKILSLNYHDCKVFIHSVDAQSSANNGIIIQVIGEMSNRGEPWKKFVQTFFLAEQPNGYFVLNDIFRFLKEDTAGEEEEEEEEEEDETVINEPPVAPANAAAAEEPSRHVEQLPSPTASATAPIEPVVNSYESEAPAPQPVPTPVAVVERQATPAPPAPQAVEEEHPHTNGMNGHVDHAESSIGEEDKSELAIPAVAEPEPEPVELITTIVEPPPPSEALVPTVKAPSPAPPVAAAPTPPPAAAAPPAPSAPSGPKTWATLAASNNRKWGNQIATDAKGVSAAAPQSPAPSPAPQKLVANGKPAAGPDTTPKGPVEVTTGQCFVKAVTDNVTEAVLKETLISRFGPVKELEIVRSKACAFLEFASPEAARKAIAVSLPAPQGEGGIRLEGKLGPNGMPPRVIVETRKERSERPVPTRGRGGPPGGEGRGNAAFGGSGGGGEGGRGGRGRGSNIRGRGVPVPK